MAESRISSRAADETDATLDRLGSIEAVLAQLRESVAALSVMEAGPGHPKWMHTKDVAEYLGLSVDAIHRLTGADAIPHAKLAGRSLFDRDEIDRWLSERSC